MKDSVHLTEFIWLERPKTRQAKKFYYKIWFIILAGHVPQYFSNIFRKKTIRPLECKRRSPLDPCRLIFKKFKIQQNSKMDYMLFANIITSIFSTKQVEKLTYNWGCSQKLVIEEIIYFSPTSQYKRKAKGFRDLGVTPGALPLF